MTNEQELCTSMKMRDTSRLVDDLPDEKSIWLKTSVLSLEHLPAINGMIRSVCSVYSETKELPSITSPPDNNDKVSTQSEGSENDSSTENETSDRDFLFCC